MINRFNSLLTVVSMAFGFAIPVTHAAGQISGNHVWDFAEYAAEPLIADGAISEDYNGVDIHLNSGDNITDAGLVWSAPGTTTSDSKTVVNNRYIVLEPEASGTVTVTFSGSKRDSSSKAPRIYIVPGEGALCMSKTNSDANGKAATASAANRATTLNAEVDAGKTYYIWPYYYNDSGVSFTVTNITYKKAVPEMKTRNIYESNMLLQRDEPVYIDGICSAAVEAAEVSLINETTGETVQEADCVIENKEWNVTLDPVSDYENTYTIKISSDGMDDITYTNVIFGDQYIFSGQSNMWMSVEKYRYIDRDAYNESAVTSHLTDKIRLMYTPGQSDYGTNVLQFDAQNKQAWRDFSSYANIKDVGAPAYTAAVKLYEETGVPIGVIDNAYPGSYISSWFDSALAIDNCNTGKNGTSNERNWYCGRIYPLRNLKLSGIFWYQGCADAATTYHQDPYNYYLEMMPKLIDSWRDLFNDPKLPFYYTQLSRIGSTIVDENNPDTGSAGKMPIKRAQTDAYLTMEDKTNVGIVSTLDLYGNYNASGERNCRTDIHLGQKQFVGDRMANLALADIYGKATDNSGNTIYRMGPLYKSSRSEGNKVIVTFDCNGSLTIMPSSQYVDSEGAAKLANGEFDADVLNEFELAGEDGIWYAAKAEITADNEVTLEADEVEAPVSVRYANTDYPESPNLTDESGLPSYVFSKRIDEIAEPADEDITITYDKNSKTLKLKSNKDDITLAAVILASYDANGRLKTAKPHNAVFSGGKVEIPMEIGADDKVFVWDSLDKMNPVADVFVAESGEPAPTATTEAEQPTLTTKADEPTATPDADIAQTYSFTFGADGNVKSGLRESPVYGQS